MNIYYENICRKPNAYLEYEERGQKIIFGEVKPII